MIGRVSGFAGRWADGDLLPRVTVAVDQDYVSGQGQPPPDSRGDLANHLKPQCGPPRDDAFFGAPGLGQLHPVGYRRSARRTNYSITRPEGLFNFAQEFG